MIIYIVGRTSSIDSSSVYLSVCLSQYIISFLWVQQDKSKYFKMDRSKIQFFFCFFFIIIILLLHAFPTY